MQRLNAQRPPYRAAWILCCILAAVVFLVYLSGSVAAGGVGSPVMPLDDAYIHFQYARQISYGQFYVYNPGLPPTSGATSFLYPYILAFGHLIGFHDLNLGIWAMAVGAVALALSAYFAYRIAVALEMTRRVAIVVPPIFALHGLIAWHYMSGMETGLAILFTLMTLYGVIDRRFGVTIAGASLSALIRPEGAILAVLEVGLWIVQPHPLRLLRNPPSPLRREGERRDWRLLFLIIPFLAAGIQPLVNYALTDSFVSSGNAAKSLFGMIPFDLNVVIGRIIENFVRLWRDLLTPREVTTDTLIGMFVSAWLAIIGVVTLIRTRERRGIGILLILWCGAFALAIATLDTAFWHFRRYQLPLIAVAFPLGIVGLDRVVRFVDTLLPMIGSRLAGLLIVLPALSAIVTAGGMLRAYVVNVGYVRDQPLQMALWLRENTPADAVIAVHDVGMMRYMGGRTTLDIVGLTTPGAADYWRNGPGAVGEFIDRMRPDYIASYGTGHGLGLGYLQDTPLYAEPLAVFPVTLDLAVNVALAADTQGVYRPDYSAADAGNTALAMPQIFRSQFQYFLRLIDTIDVADIESERNHDYRWTNIRSPNGFPSEYYSFNTIGCIEACPSIDGGRRINGEESFTIHVTPNDLTLLVIRLHPGYAGEFDLYVNDVRLETRVIPPLSGSFLEVPILIEADLVTNESLHIRIVPRISDGDYMPYMHLIYQAPEGLLFIPLVDFTSLTYLNDQIAVGHSPILLEDIDGRLHLQARIGWQRKGQPSGDYKVFVHVLDQDGNIVAQYDNRPGQGALPPGNWINLVFDETIDIDVSHLAQGAYSVAFGLYNPVTFERLIPHSQNIPIGDEFGRFILDTVEIP